MSEGEGHDGLSARRGVTKKKKRGGDLKKSNSLVLVLLDLL